MRYRAKQNRTIQQTLIFREPHFVHRAAARIAANSVSVRLVSSIGQSNGVCAVGSHFPFVYAGETCCAIVFVCACYVHLILHAKIKQNTPLYLTCGVLNTNKFFGSPFFRTLCFLAFCAFHWQCSVLHAMTRSVLKCVTKVEWCE